MKATSVKTMWAKAVKVSRRLKAEHDSVTGECTLINNKRLLFGSAIASAACWIPILELLGNRSLADINPLWRHGVLLANIIMCGGLFCIFLFSLRYRKATVPLPGMRVLQVISAAFFMLCGISITILDQLVSGGVTPFMLACISVGAVMLLRPRTAAVLFTSAYAILLVAGGLIFPSLQFFSVRINGFSSVCIGMMASVILWRTQCVNLLQSRQLGTQKHVLEQIAYYDNLTGLTNRRFFDTMVLQKEQSGALLMLDLDDFKRVNDTYGHPAGDAALQQLAQVLEETLRKSDVISRFGGEEFMIMLPTATAAEAAAVAEKLRTAIERTAFVLPGGVTERMTVSIGAALCTPRQGDPYVAVDQALYQAKRRGKNSVVCCWEISAEE